MDDESINEVVAEIKPLVAGRAPGKIFQVGPLSMAIDFRLRDHGYLFVSVEPAQPQLYLVKRRTRALEKQSVPLSQFALALRKDLSNTTVRSVKKDAEDRVVRFAFAGLDELGRAIEHTLVMQSTGRSANLFLLDRLGVIVHRARPTRNPGQQVGETYERPQAQTERQTPKEDSELLKIIRSGRFESPSAAADAYFSSLLSQQTFDAGAGGKGSRAVLEVRSREVPFILEHGQIVGRLVYEKMLARPDAMYGQRIGSNYQAQGLKLSKHFRV